MKVFIGCDHAGFDVKKEVIDMLKSLNLDVQDLGCYSKDSVDYADYGHKVACAVKEHKDSFGILICGTGIGISISANKHKGIRAALCHDAYTASMARMHNDANVLAFGQRVVGLGVIKSMIDAFFTTPFEGGRHEQRVRKIEEA